MRDNFPQPVTTTFPPSLDTDRVMRLLADACPDALCVLSMNETILFANRAFRSQSGHQEMDLLGRSYLDLIHPGDLERVAAALRPAFKGKSCQTVVHRKLSAASDPAWWTSTWSPLVDQEGQQIGVLSRESSVHGRTPAEEVFLRDYTRLEERLSERTRALHSEVRDRRSIEQQLRIKELAMDTSISAMAMVDLQGRLLYANDAALRLWGFDKKSSRAGLGLDILDFWRDRGEVQGILDQTVRTGKWSGEVIARQRNGTLFDVQLSATAIHDTRGTLIGIFGSCIDVTDRKRTELALRQSEERFRRITEAVTDYIYTVSIDGSKALRSVNCPVCEAVTGYTAAEFDKDPGLWLTITPEEDREQVRNHASRILAGDDPGPIRHRIHRKDGSLRWVHRLPVLHRNSSGAVVSYDVLVRDISDRRAAEEALRESESRFRHMADLLPQPLYEANAAGLLTFANKAGLRMFGYTEEDLRSGIRTADMLVPEDRGRARANMQRVLRNEPTLGNEYSALRKDNTSFPVIIFSAPITKAGRTTGLRGIVIDITERVRAEEVLQDTALKFRQLAETISEVFFIKDTRSRRTLYVSPAYESVWGRTCRSVYENPESFRDCVHPEDRELVADVINRQGLGTPTEAEYRIIRPDGELRWIRSKTFPVKNRRGRHYRIVGVAEDITERRKAEEAMRNHAAQLQALSSRLVDVRESERRSIARELHDEIGQIATGIKLGLDLLSNTTAGDTQGQINRLQVMSAELISEVRNLSLGLRPSMLDDLGLLPALAWLFKRFGDQTGIAVNFTHCGIARRFPMDTETVIYRAIQEAVTNAARHADVDEVSVELTADRTAISLSIVDRGAGFVPDKVLSATDSIGLFGMRERVDSIGGSLSVASAPEAGTSISIRIPLTDNCARDIDHGHNDHHC